MSHFSVFVIGDNVDEQLAPYHEFECTGEDDQYVKDVDVTAECKEQGLDWFGLEDKTVTDLSQLDKAGVHKYGYALVDAAGDVIKAVNRTNPNKKWDWYQIGGRWSGFLKIKAGGEGAMGERSWTNRDEPHDPTRADIARKGDIDFDGMRFEAGREAAEKFDAAMAALAAAGAPSVWDRWDHVRDVMFKGDIEKARAHYNAQPCVKALQGMTGFWDTPDVFLTTRSDYIERARNQACVPYALVHKSEWVGRGAMGWWGVSTGDADQDAWNRMVNEMLDALPDDTLITVVDCHI